MRFIFLILSIGLFSFQLVQAQDLTITGKVISAEDGTPLPGVSVIIKGTINGTVTRYDGTYALAVPSDAQILQFSFVGMDAQEVLIAGQTTINITLKASKVGLDEVIVVAYGKESKRSITGAVTSIDSKALGNQIAISPLRALQGSAPGVNVITTGGQPGEDPTIRIRGIGSISASQDPLIVVDGIVYNGAISNISSEQIESINTLKDAAATSLYGSRAANGVILITTKKGKYNSATSVTFNVKTGFSSPAVKPFGYVGAEEYMKYTWESLKNTNIYSGGMTDADARTAASNALVSRVKYNPYNVSKPIDVNGDVVAGAQLLWDTHWYDEMIRKNASYQDYSAEIKGGSEKLSFFFSGNYLKQQGSVIESDYNRYTGRLNLEAKVNKWMIAGMNTSYSRSKQNYPDQSGTSYTNSMQWVNSIASIYPLYARDAAGELKKDDLGNLQYDYGNAGGGQLINAVRPLFGGENAVSSTKLNKTEYKRNSFFSNVFAKIDIYKGLSFKTTFGYENYTYASYIYDHYKYGSGASVKGRISQDRNVTESYTITNNLKYEKSFGNHAIVADAISEVVDYNKNTFNAQATGYLPNVYVLSGSTKPEIVGGYIDQERLVSYLGRLSYSYSQKYYLLLSFRRDGSTRFSADDRWGNFYSAGANWILSDESFLKGNKILSFAKLRVSYGELGNNSGIGYFPYVSAYKTGQSNGDNPGVIQTGIVDEHIKWEKSGLFNTGFDFGLLKNRITGTIEYYNKKSIDLIFDKPLSPSTGNVSYLTNIATVSNKGIELNVTTNNITTTDFEWTTSFNISTNKNEILSLPQKKVIKGSKQLMVGHSVYDFYIEKYVGVDPENGDALWLTDINDAEGNVTGTDTTNVYDDASRYYVGSSLPDYIGGFSSYFRYKNFDVNILFNYSIGGKIYDYSYAALMSSLNRPGQQLCTDISGRWQKPGDITDIPKLYASNNSYNDRSTRFLFDNNYMRLKALTIGYKIPTSFLKKMNITDAKIYLQADNIWTLQSHKGIDPEQDIIGETDDRSYLMKTYSIGINLTF
jgi:TonB-linked SusC/RagA family outer membrane protein